MKYVYKKLTIDSYLASLYHDGFKHSSKHSEEELKNIILNIGIFKFKGYVKAFRTNVSNYSMDDILDVYYADREVALNMFRLSSQVEIKLKSILIEVAYSLTDNPFFYLIKENYNEIGFSIKGEAISDWEVKAPHPQQKTEIYQYYQDYYLGRYDFESNKEFYLKDKELLNFGNTKTINYPPFHYFVENMTLGALISILSHLMIDGQSILKLIASKFNMYDPHVFLNYLLRLKELRNRCAHNGRIFNRNYRGVKAHGKHKEFRKIIYEHKLIDVYYAFCWLLNGKNKFETTEKLIEAFTDEIFKDCETNTKDLMVNIMRTR